jgi:hypothetical protein
MDEPIADDVAVEKILSGDEIPPVSALVCGSTRRCGGSAGQSRSWTARLI